ncbi:MAG: type IV pilus twitching motility protein PilT [Gemmatimonadales bacterium]
MTAVAEPTAPAPSAAPTDPVATFKAVLRKAVEIDASDIHISAGGPFRLRVRGQIASVSNLGILSAESTARIAAEILVSARKATPETVDAQLRGLREVDCSYSLAGAGRFRVNLCSQRGSIAAVLRNIPTTQPDLEQLGLPSVVRDLAMEDRGLILVTGITGSGKSSTLASMLAHVNRIKAAKVVTIEDPIEFLHQDERCTILQRELGGDTDSFAGALRAALRQDPDIIMVGEMRDRETIDIALKAAETGHMVFSTTHTTDAIKTITRLISVFEPAEQVSIRQRLSETLRAVISQRLLPRKDGTGRVVAVEIMRNTATVEELIADPERTTEIKDLIAQGKSQYGMQTFDQHLTELYHAELIALEVATAAATSPADFARNLQFQ